MDDRLQALLDRAAIAEVLHGFCRAVDRCDWDSVRDCYHPDAHDDHGDYRGGVDGLVDWLVARHADGSIPVSMHSITNIMITTAGDVATSECHFHTVKVSTSQARATFRVHGLDPDHDADARLLTRTHGRYLDKLSRRAPDIQWRIDRRVTVVEATSATILRGPDPFGPEWTRSSRGPDDPLYLLGT